MKHMELREQIACTLVLNGKYKQVYVYLKMKKNNLKAYTAFKKINKNFEDSERYKIVEIQ